MNRDFGEAFECYYRAEISKREGRGTIEQIREEAIDGPHAEALLSEDEVANRGLTIATTVFSLSNERWESNANVYLRAVDQQLEDVGVVDVFRVLEAARNQFENRFRGTIVERGESTNLIDQIVKRTGEETRARFERVFKGIHPKREAQRLLELSLDDNERFRIVDELQALTLSQLRAVRGAFRDICIDQTITTLQSANEGQGGEPRKTKQRLKSLREYLSRVQSRRTENLPELSAFEFECALQHRSDRELELFQERWRAQGDESSSVTKLVSYLRNRFSSGRIARLCVRIEQGEYLATLEAFEQLFEEQRFRSPVGPQGFFEAFAEWLLPAEFEAPTQLPRRNRLLRMDWAPQFVELEWVPHFRSFDPQFTDQSLRDVWAQLSSQGRLSLPFEIAFAPQISLFQRAILLAELLESSPSTQYFLPHVLRLFFGLDPWESCELQRFFRAETGVELVDALTEFCSSERLPRVVLERLVSGALRYPFDADIVHLSLQWQREQEQRVRLAGTAAPLSTSLRNLLLDEGVDSEKKIRAAVEFLSKRSPDVMSVLTLLYPEDSPQRRSLSMDVQQALGRRGTSLLRGLRLLPDLLTIASRLRDHPNLFSNVHEIHPLLNIILVQEMTARHEGTLSDVRLAVQAGNELREARVLAESYRFLIEAVGFRTALLREEAFNSELVEWLLHEVSAVDLLHFERLYCLLWGSFRRDLQWAFAKQRISQETVVQLLLRIEGMPPDFFSLLDDAFQSKNLSLLCSLLAQQIDEHECLAELYEFLYGRNIRSAIEEHWQDDKRVARASLLCLGFSAENVAQRLRESILSFEGEALGTTVLELLSHDGGEQEKSLIPDDPDWVPQMMEQVRLAYSERFGPGLIKELRGGGVAEEVLHKICYRLYGTDAADFAVNLYALTLDGDKSFERFCELVGSADKRLFERTYDFYLDYFDEAKAKQFVELVAASQQAASIDPSREDESDS